MRTAYLYAATSKWTCWYYNYIALQFKNLPISSLTILSKIFPIITSCNFIFCKDDLIWKKKWLFWENNIFSSLLRIYATKKDQNLLLLLIWKTLYKYYDSITKCSCLKEFMDTLPCLITLLDCHWLCCFIWILISNFHSRPKIYDLTYFSSRLPIY